MATEQPASATAPQTCAFCGYPIPEQPVATIDGAFCCSNRCHNAMKNDEREFAERFGFKRFVPCVAVLDTLLPYGVPANSFVLLEGEEGMRHRSLQTELVWRALNRGEPAIMITYVDPAIAVVEHFLTFGWNVLPYLESGALQILDCFTNRLREKHQVPEFQSEWNEYLHGFLDESVDVINETDDLRSVEDKLHSHLERADMVEQGVVVIDSLNELISQGNEGETGQFIKEVRGDICSRKFVPIFTSMTVEGGNFPQERSYLFDGIIEMRRNEDIVGGFRLKQLSIRKMDGVSYRPDWVAYEHAGQRGFHQFDPEFDLQSVYRTLSQRTRPPQFQSGSGHPQQSLYQ